MSFGENMRVARLASGLSADEMAEVVGVTKAAISVFELGHKYPKSSTLVKIAKALNVSLDYLMCQEGVSIQRACRVEVERATAANKKRLEKARNSGPVAKLMEQAMGEKK